MARSNDSTQPFPDRADQKRAAREADARALTSGAKSRDELHRENTFLPAQPGFKIDWSRVDRIR